MGSDDLVILPFCQSGLVLLNRIKFKECYITVRVTDKNYIGVPEAKNKITFSIEGPGEIVATDNGDPANLVSFALTEREAYFGLVLVIVRSEKGKTGIIKITASSFGLKDATAEIKS